MYNSGDVSNKLKCLTDTLRDSSNNLRSLDYLVLSPANEFRPRTNYKNETSNKNNFLKIEKSLENMSEKQNQIEDELKRMPHSIKDELVGHSNFATLSRTAQKAASTTFLDSMQSYEEAAFNVNKKLQEAQEKLRNDQISIENRNSSLKKTIDLSPDLKSALIEKSSIQNNTSSYENQEIDKLTKTIIKFESDNSALKFDLDSLKRQLLSEVGAKNSLLSNNENFKLKVCELEEQHVLLKKELDRLNIENDVNKRKAESNAKCQEKLFALQRENDQLKSDTMNCGHSSKMEELRRQKDKAERSTTQMKDQMLDITKQMESKQSHISKLMDEIRDLQEKISGNKSSFQDLEEKYQESQNELRHKQKSYQEVVHKVDSLEHSIIEMEVNKNKGFLIRDDNIERLEGQCAKYKNEIDKFYREIQENNCLMNDIHKENESLRNQLLTAQTQMDVLRREMEALLRTRSVQDEILKRREQENESYINKIKDLEFLVETTERNCDKHRFDAEIYNRELNQARETIAVQEERLINLTNTSVIQQEQLLSIKSELSMSNRKNIILDNQINNLEKQLDEYQNREEQLEHLKHQLEESQNSREKMSVDIVKKSQKYELENQNNVKKLEQMLDAERAALKVLMNRCDRQTSEINRMHQEFWNREQLVQRFRKKYVKVKQELEAMLKQKDVDRNLQENNFTEEILEKEQEILLEKERYAELVKERDQTLRWIIVDVDGVVDLLSQLDVSCDEKNKLKSSSYLLNNSSIDLKSCPSTSSALSTLGGLDINKCFLDIKSKISWLRSGINRMITSLELSRTANMELQEEVNIANERIVKLEEDKQILKNVELEEAKNCLAKLRVKEKNEINLQLKCDRLQSELHNVRQYLKENLTDCNHSHCQNFSYN